MFSGKSALRQSYSLAALHFTGAERLASIDKFNSEKLYGSQRLKPLFNGASESRRGMFRALFWKIIAEHFKHEMAQIAQGGFAGH